MRTQMRAGPPRIDSGLEARRSAGMACKEAVVHERKPYGEAVAPYNTLDKRGQEYVALTYLRMIGGASPPGLSAIGNSSSHCWRHCSISRILE